MLEQKQWYLVVLCMVVAIVILASFSHRRFQTDSHGKGEAMFTLTAPAFKHDGEMPSFYTCDGHDISPELDWHNPPSGTKSFALICNDPDALGGTWIHWIAYDIPGTLSKLEEHIKMESIGAHNGLNSWGKAGYGGPCPPLKQHRYVFTLYALDIAKLVTKPMPDQEGLTRAMEGHILGQAELIGKYRRITEPEL